MPRSETVQSKGLRFHYLREGEGGAGRDPVVLLHGFPQTSHMWRHQIPVLAKDYAVYAPDTRGYGGTEKPRVRVTRDLLARDVIDFMDAVGIERAILCGHDWGGIIAFKAALDHPDRFSRLALIDTLTSVWIPWGIHGYWFKCEPQAEEFFEKHHEEFILSTMGQGPSSYGGPPYSPWAPVEGSAGSEALSEFNEEYASRWTAADREHFVTAFSDPGAWFHAVEYYRHALPFHWETEDASAPGGRRHEFLSNPRVAEMWNHPDLLFGHPDWQDNFPVFAPEDRGRTFDKPALYLYSPFLVPQAFPEEGLPPDDYIPTGNPYADSFAHHFPDFRARGARCGHFMPEEAPERTNEVLTSFFAGEI